MKSAFTMIELVFVIVILGVLASIAIPRLGATRDDASATKATAEIRNSLNELTAYYIINSNFSKEGEISASGDVAQMSPTFASVLNRTSDKWAECVKITLSNTNSSIKLESKNSTSSYCKAVLATPAVKEWLGLSEGIQVGGSTIFK